MSDRGRSVGRVMARSETRVTRIAAALLAEQGFVCLVDVLVDLGWLTSPTADAWERGRLFPLDVYVSVDPEKVVAAIAALQHWAEDRGVEASEADYYREVRFITDGDDETERACRTLWGSADAAKAARAGPPRRPKRMKVLVADNALTCERCGVACDFLLKGKTSGVCMDCADLGHLEFLPSGDPALTRRATEASRQSAVVMHWNARRARFERQGILAEPAAIERAARECLSDADVRVRRRERQLSCRAEQDANFAGEFAAAIREQFPGCPTDRAEAIAFHAAARGSGRVGRSAAGRSLDAAAVRLAVIASVRHVDTEYDALLLSGVDRDSARDRVRQRVDDIVTAWRDGVAMLDETL